MRASWLWLLLGLNSGLPAIGQVTETYNYTTFGGNPSVSIPDGNPAGMSDPRTVSSAITQIGSITVSLDISSGYNSDLYAYLQHSGGFSVLLNRVGRTAASAFGYDDRGFLLTLSDSAAPIREIHKYQAVEIPGANSPLTGQWRPDGRNADPAFVLETDGRTAKLDVFNGLNANGVWTLFLADMSGGDVSALNAWGIQITAVPEPGAYALVAGLGLVAFAVFRRSQ